MYIYYIYIYIWIYIYIYIYIYYKRVYHNITYINRSYLQAQMFFGQAQTDISKDMLGTLSSVRRASLDDGRPGLPDEMRPTKMGLTCPSVMRWEKAPENDVLMSLNGHFMGSNGFYRVRIWFWVIFTINHLLSGWLVESVKNAI